MSIYVGKDKATLFHGDHHPASLYKGDKLIAGFETPTLTGKNQISFQSPYKANMDSVKAYGVGKQEKLEGKNLFGGSHISGGEYTKHNGFNCYKFIDNNNGLKIKDFIKGKIYTLSITLERPGSSAGIGVIVEYDDGTSQGFDISSNKPKIITTSYGKNVLSIRSSYVLGTEVYVYLSKTQLELGSTPTPYEPYTGGIPAPNPDYPIEPKFYPGGSLEVRGKNLATLINFPDDKYIHVENNVIHIANIYNYGVGVLKLIFPDLKAGETYTINGDTTGNQFIYLRGSKFTWRFGQKHTVVQSELDELFYMYGSIDGTVTIRNLQIELGSTSTPYEPYYPPQIAQIPTLRALPDGSVRDEYDVRSGVLTKRIYEWVLTGEEKWNFNYGLPILDKLPLSGLAGYNHPNRIFCNFCSFCTFSNLVGTAIGIYDDTWNFDSNEKMQNMLKEKYASGNPGKIWYPLATPIIEHLSPKLLTQHPTTTILTQTPNEVPIKKTVEGQVIAVDDVGKEGSEVECKVERVNLFDTTKTTRGKIWYRGKRYDGYKDYNGSPLIQVNPQETYVLSGRKTQIQNQIDFFDKDKIYIKEVPWAGQGESHTLEPDVYYIAFNQANDETEMQLEVGSTPTPYTPYIPDLSKVVVSRFGDNMLNNKHLSYYGWYVIGQNNISDYSTYLKKGETYTLTVADKQDVPWSIRLTSAHITNSDPGGIVQPGNKSLTFTMTDPTGFYYLFIYREASGDWTDGAFTSWQLVKGTSTETVPYSREDYTPLPSGEVSGMTSLSPNMTILTDTPGAVITATYDTNQNEETIYADMSAKVYKEANNE